MKKTFLTFGLLLLSLSVIAQKTITSAEIGLVGDGKTLNTTAIQATIHRLSQEGDGVLQLNRGTYLREQCSWEARIPMITLISVN